jgi:hypothetical protein
LVTPGGEPEPLTGIEQCALGKTWSLDMAAIAEQVKADLGRQGVAVTDVTAEGSQSLTWGLDGHVDVATDYTISISAAPAADQAIVVTSTHTGPMSGKAYINGDVAIPRTWDATGLDVKSVGELNGGPLDPIPFTIPRLDLDDSVGLELTCDGSTLTTHPRGGDVTQTWTLG